VNAKTQKSIRTAELAVARLVEECHKHGPLYVQHPGAVAQVSRTGKWLLNAIAALRRELSKPRENDYKQAS
jgi:hypothetical protein